MKWYSYIAPKKQEAKREVFEETKSFNNGKIRDLQNLRMEYIEAPEGSPERKVVRETILHRSDTIDLEDLPDSLRSFVKKVRP